MTNSSTTGIISCILRKISFIVAFRDLPSVQCKETHLILNHSLQQMQRNTYCCLPNCRALVVDAQSEVLSQPWHDFWSGKSAVSIVYSIFDVQLVDKGFEQSFDIQLVDKGSEHHYIFVGWVGESIKAKLNEPACCIISKCNQKYDSRVLNRVDLSFPSDITLAILSYFLVPRVIHHGGVSRVV